MSDTVTTLSLDLFPDETPAPHWKAVYADALCRALHCVEGASARWASLRPDCPDADLCGGVRDVFGGGGGFSLPGWQVFYQGGASPGLRIERAGAGPGLMRMEAGGAEFLRDVRRVLWGGAP